MVRICASFVCVLLLMPVLGWAHAYLVKSVPARRANLLSSPSRIQLWFNERLEARFSRVSVVDERGGQADLGDAHVPAEDPKQLSIGVRALTPGRYVVQFRVLSVDGHVVDQSFPFVIRESRQSQ